MKFRGDMWKALIGLVLFWVHADLGSLFMTWGMISLWSSSLMLWYWHLQWKSIDDCSSRVGYPVRSVPFRNSHHSPCVVHPLGNSKRVKGTIGVDANEHVFATGSQDGSHHLTRCVRMVGIQYPRILHSSILSASSEFESLADCPSTGPCWNFGERFKGHSGNLAWLMTMWLGSHN